MTDMYPQAHEIMGNLSTPYPDEVRMVEQFLDGRRDYPQEAIQRGEADRELTELAHFLQFFLKSLNRNTKIIFGDGSLDTLYLFSHDQIHINIPNLVAGLHEIGHSLYGPSEIEACRYSTSLMLHVKQMKYKIPVFIEHKLQIA